MNERTSHKENGKMLDLPLCLYPNASLLCPNTAGSITSNRTTYPNPPQKTAWCVYRASLAVRPDTHLPLRPRSLVITHNKNIITCIVHDVRDTDLRAEQKAGPAAI